MSSLRLFTNFSAGSYVINLFIENGHRAPSAQLACPFFTIAKPLQILQDAGCRDISLIVRLCGATSPIALREAKGIEGVRIRYFTDPAFHSKLYILGGIALIGSANLTDAGLHINRELSITISEDEEIFDDLPSCFDDLWNSASALTDDVLNGFAEWHNSPNNHREDEHIEGVEPCSPQTANVDTQNVSRERKYLESFRRQYAEILLPAYYEVREVYEAKDVHHPKFHDLWREYEIDRFLHWAKLNYTTDENLQTFPLLPERDHRRKQIEQCIDEWIGVDFEVSKFHSERLQRLREIFDSPENLDKRSFDELTYALLGCSAFDEQLRFNRGGRPALVRAFQRDNSFEKVTKALKHLVFGTDTDFVRRMYDCSFLPEYKLAHFGKRCVYELYGWVNNNDIPPLNGRTIKALRFFGFDVQV